MTSARNASCSSLRVRLTRRSGTATPGSPDFRTTCRSCSVLDISPPLVVDGIFAPVLQLNTMSGNLQSVSHNYRNGEVHEHTADVCMGVRAGRVDRHHRVMLWRGARSAGFG